MGDLVNFLFGMLVLFAPPILLLRYFYRTYKRLMSDDNQNDKIIVQDSLHGSVVNSLTSANKVTSGGENTLKIPSSLDEVDIADAISPDEFYLWLIEEEFIKLDDEN